MNKHHSELPKEETIKQQKNKNELNLAIIKINSYVQDKDFRSAYNAIEKFKHILNSSGAYTDEQRQIFVDFIINIVEKELGPQIEKEYKEIVEFYKKNYTKTELEKSPYPESIDKFASSKAKEQLMEKYKNRRFGGYMHVVINNVIKKYEPDLMQDIILAEKRKSINKKIKNVKQIDDWDR